MRKQTESTESQNKDKESHRERVAMRQILRDSGIVPKDADNGTCDRWLYRHGYLFASGYQPPANRVERLKRNVGQEH
jgi:hypothetical protein